MTIDARTLATALAVLEWIKTLPQTEQPFDYMALLDARIALTIALKSIHFEVKE